MHRLLCIDDAKKDMENQLNKMNSIISEFTKVKAGGFFKSILQLIENSNSLRIQKSVFTYKASVYLAIRKSSFGKLNEINVQEYQCWDKTDIELRLENGSIVNCGVITFVKLNIRKYTIVFRKIFALSKVKGRKAIIVTSQIMKEKLEKILNIIKSDIEVISLEEK